MAARRIGGYVAKCCFESSCMGLDIKAGVALRRLLDALDQAEEIIASHDTYQQ